ncbi:putative immunity protein [Paenibacillus alkalitolerans]|uniref:putative immunity protein n=1 Tax=Paenibacillus alkalitolerans TaxID=2799335 RepID=UPI0018F42378|nr:hypothetical protein [Paenibacillus alkalitolerans]
METGKFKDSKISKSISELASHKTLALWAADCAERVLRYFEEKHPDDRRPREAIDAGRAWVRGRQLRRLLEYKDNH